MIHIATTPIRYATLFLVWLIMLAIAVPSALFALLANLGELALEPLAEVADGLWSER